MIRHPYQQFFRKIVSDSGMPPGDCDELNQFFDQLEKEQAEFFYVLLSEDASWLSKILVNYRAKCAAFRTRDDKMWEEVLRTEVAEIDHLNAG